MREFKKSRAFDLSTNGEPRALGVAPASPAAALASSNSSEPPFVVLRKAQAASMELLLPSSPFHSSSISSGVGISASHDQTRGFPLAIW